MSVTRSELRKLRNKVYIRILTSQSIHKQLNKYRHQTEAFIEERKQELPVHEVATLYKRVERTEKAAAVSSNIAIDRSVGDEIISRLRRLRGQHFPGSPIYPSSRENMFFSRQDRDLVPSLASTFTSTLPMMCRKEESSMVTTNLSKCIPMLNSLRHCETGRAELCDKPSIIAQTAVETASDDTYESSQGSEILTRLSRLRGQFHTGSSTPYMDMQRKLLNGQVLELTSSVSTCSTEERLLTASSIVSDSSAVASGYSMVECSEVDTISEAMANLMTFAMSRENLDMVSSFMEELQNILSMNTKVIAVTANLPVAEEVLDIALRKKTKKNLWTRLKNSLLG